MRVMVEGRRWASGNYLFTSDADQTNGGGPDAAGNKLRGSPVEMPFCVEIWDSASASVERVLALTADGSIGYAAFYAATREYPNRHITLRHNNTILSRWNNRSN